MGEGLKIAEEHYSQSLRRSDFPATKFFKHLFNGTEFFHNKEFDKAITEWERAAKLQLDAKSLKKMPGSASFQSSLDDVPLVGLLYALCFNAQTGVAIIRNEHAYKKIFFKEGLVVFSRTSKPNERIGNFLLKSSLMSPFKLEAIATQAEKEGIKLGRFLVMQGLLAEEEIREVLALQVQEIICDLFSWEHGEFYFYENEVEEEDMVVNYTPLEVALIASRRALNFSTFRRMIPHNRVIFRVPPQIERDKVKILEELNANEKFIFSLIDGSRNVDQLIKFSGNDEISIMSILYRLVLLGFIEKTRDIGIYEDKEFEEIFTFLGALFRVSKMLAQDLSRELGAMTKVVLNKAIEGLDEDYRKIFDGISMDGDIIRDLNKILKNISRYYPDPSDRFVFIDSFCELINGIIQETNRILGLSLTNQMVLEIDKVRLDIFNFYTDSPTKRKVLEALGKIVTQFPAS